MVSLDPSVLSPGQRRHRGMRSRKGERYAAERRIRRIDRGATTSPTAAITSWPKPQESPRDRGTPTHIGHELIAAGMLILAGGGRDLPLDYDELERWTRVGYERVVWSRKCEW